MPINSYDEAHKALETAYDIIRSVHKFVHKDNQRVNNIIHTSKIVYKNVINRGNQINSLRELEHELNVIMPDFLNDLESVRRISPRIWVDLAEIQSRTNIVKNAWEVEYLPWIEEQLKELSIDFDEYEDTDEE
jgi:hypothetical protein